MEAAAQNGISPVSSRQARKPLPGARPLLAKLQLPGTATGTGRTAGCGRTPHGDERGTRRRGEGRAGSPGQDGGLQRGGGSVRDDGHRCAPPRQRSAMRSALSMSTATIIVGIGASIPSTAIATRWRPMPAADGAAVGMIVGTRSTACPLAAGGGRRAGVFHAQPGRSPGMVDLPVRLPSCDTAGIAGRPVLDRRPASAPGASVRLAARCPPLPAREPGATPFHFDAGSAVQGARLPTRAVSRPVGLTPLLKARLVGRVAARLPAKLQLSAARDVSAGARLRRSSLTTHGGPLAGRAPRRRPYPDHRDPVDDPQSGVQRRSASPNSQA